ncbi:hypothetical protein ACE6H2_027063 [Prunus campanulata]
MPIKLDISIWSSLLRACGSHQNLELAEKVFQQLIKIDPLNDPAYALISNIHAKAGRWDDVSRASKKLNELGWGSNQAKECFSIMGWTHGNMSTRTPELFDFIQAHYRIRDREIHSQLQLDLIVHLWQLHAGD